MKALTLTEEHKSKLLEMCKAFLPENGKVYFSDCDTIEYEGKRVKLDEYDNCGHLIFPKLTNWKKQNSGSIHWFEFCLTSLLQKMTAKTNIPNPKRALELNNFLVGVVYGEFHPIDYLYTQFKSLNI